MFLIGLFEFGEADSNYHISKAQIFARIYYRYSVCTYQSFERLNPDDVKKDKRQK